MSARPPQGGPGRHGPGGFMTMPVSKPRQFRRSFRRLAATLAPEAPLIALVIVLAVVSVTLAIAGPRILGRATDILFEGVVGGQLPVGTTKDQAVAMLRAGGQDRVADMVSSMDVVPGEGVDFDALARTLGLLAALYLSSAVFSWAQGYVMAGVTQRTVYRMRRSVDEKLGRLPLAYFDRQSRGDILSRVTNDIDNIAQTLQQSLTQLITAVLTVVGVLAMMVSISPVLAVISLLTVPVSIVITILIASRSQKQFAAQWERTGRLNGHIEEMHSGHSIVKVFGRQDEAIRVFDAHNEEVYDASFRAQFISGIIQPALNFVANLNYVAIAVIGGVRVANGQMSLGDVQAFIQYSRQFTMPIVQTASIMNVLQSAVASAERVFELLDEREEIADEADPKVLENVEGRVAFEGVSFRYEPETPLIDDLNLVVEPGRTIAIVGPTGAGKTTLVNLLMRFYEIDAGRITVDGIDTREMARDNLRRTFGMVLQDTWLFSGTMRENIAYGADGATEDRVYAAARAAHVDHFVRTLPDGYDTVLDDEASNVSQGERQLLTIARAFLVDPPMLILDEATSSVDTRTEVLIQRAMARLMRGRTSFVIAHRLSTIRDADSILVMDHGQIIEQGTHEELIARKGFYADLYASQFEETGVPGPALAVPRAPLAAAPTVSSSVAGPTHGPGSPPHGSAGPPHGPAGTSHGRDASPTGVESGRPRSRARRVAAIAAFAVTMGALLAGYGLLRTAADEDVDGTPETVVHEGNRIVAPGVVVPATVAIEAPESGTVAGLAAAEGQSVRAGQVLVRLEDAREAAEVRGAEAELEAALAAVAAARAGTSADSGARTDPEALASALTALDEAWSRAEAAAESVDRTVLRAPIDGRVSRIDVEPGQAVLAGASLLLLVDDRDLVVEADELSEADIRGVEPGDAAMIALGPLPGTRFGAQVVRIDRVDAPGDGDPTYRVIVRPEHADGRWRPAMSAEVTIPQRR